MNQLSHGTAEAPAPGSDELRRELEQLRRREAELEAQVSRLSQALERSEAARRTGEAELRAGSDRLLQVLTTMPVLLAAVDADDRVVFWNRECERVTGYAAGDVIGRSDYLPLFVPDKRQRAAVVRRMRDDPSGFRDWQVELRRKDGERRVIAWSNISPGAPISGWSAWMVGVDVSERRQTEEALNESRLVVQLALEAARAGWWEWEPASGTVCWQTAAHSQRAQGAVRPSSLSEFLQLVHPDDRARVEAALRAALADDTPYAEVFRLLRGGSYHWLDSRGRLQRGGVVRPDRIVGIDMDVDAWVAAQERLSAGEHRLRLTLEAARMVVWEWDISGGVIQAGTATGSLFGFDPRPLPGSLAEAFDYVHPEDRDRVRAALERATAPGSREPFEAELRVIDGRGVAHWVLAKGSVQHAEPGGAARLVGVMIDINERREAEDEVRRLNHELEAGVRERTAELQQAQERLELVNAHLRHSRDLLRTIADSIDDGLVLVDNDGSVLLVNQAVGAIYGQHAEWIVGRAWAAICPTTAAIIADARANGPATTRYTLTSTSGHERTLDAHAFPAGDGQVVLHVSDVSERLQYGELALQNERLAASRQVAAIVAHEVNTPLQTLQNLIYLLDTGPADERGVYVGLIREEIDRIGALIRRLMDMSRPGESESRELDAGEILDRVLLLTAGTLTRRRISVEQELRADRTVVLGRSDQLTQVLLNLVLNAADAMPHGGTLTLRSSVQPLEHTAGAPGGRQGGDAFALEVSDTGQGIPPELRDRIFEPFFTTKQEGSGIGLAVSAQIIARHGGTIGVRSTVGAGSTFVVALPLVEST